MSLGMRFLWGNEGNSFCPALQAFGEELCYNYGQQSGVLAAWAGSKGLGDPTFTQDVFSPPKTQRRLLGQEHG